MNTLKRLRLTLITGAFVLAFSGPAMAAPATDLEYPDCPTTCTKTLKPGERIVVGDSYAYAAVTAQGSSNAPVRFIVKRGFGQQLTKIYEGTSRNFSLPLRSYLMPSYFPGVFRAVAINDGPGNATVTLSLRVDANA